MAALVEGQIGISWGTVVGVVVMTFTPVLEA